jgi:protein SMG8
MLRSLLDVEGQFSEARCSKVLPLALAAYQENLPSHYSSQYHENKVIFHFIFNQEALQANIP